MWARRPEQALEIAEGKRNSKYLPGVNLPRTMTATHELSMAINGADQVYLSVPSQSLRENLKGLRPLLENAEMPIVSLMKGVERASGLRMSQVIEQEIRLRPRAHRGGFRAESCSRDRPRAAHGRGGRLAESGDR